ncbi:putative Molybdenum cofactor sulfurase/Pyruvate kinase [Vibrio nigripulchritudo SFn27]|uniref:Putative Molybdenum cofactor sulfurase/Pyruvate kinase n=1 Tax=Vibrio nigripulchritudo TaxID=28173 RepID=U4JVX7_9VIBR|nr:MOSC domain-containing protein [Vibrio nigripulchritudo]CCN83493.1 putative Molybdenum cofactor sulfurase/Pyruvate kinase [Vibrio nigripulchritudo BLFn1]CCN90969.1 putative Molybdenum cofactor sulfurase/Pyruvate kinase [Vibrio nigripulchritudo SFn27]CCN95194.1 putative Molybdenum cofactor sulfurase/Pyruvate kinase [Vibrio nigripulchritudo ENn2]CCO42314.1 putative Molybdenum cofactor sulfurase/Pyruvate kinase [Vibrio nigripulchritudo SFn135]CCO52209.1 putative Molybdenum cofactor sulfurase/P
MRKVGTVTSLLTGKVSSITEGVTSGIDKHPVDTRHWVNLLGLVGDEQADKRYHGGVEKALHAYASEHYERWVAKLGDAPRFHQIGAFGENLSTQGLDEDTICLGDIYQIGECLVEVSQGRMPCWKLNVRFDRPDMSLLLQETLWTGWYFRILREGHIEAGDDIYLTERPFPEWPLSKVTGLIFTGCMEEEALQSLLNAPLVNSWRKLVERRLATGELEDWSYRLYGEPR